MSPQNVEFSRETATRAVDLLFRIYFGVFAGAAADSPLAQWGGDRRHVMAELEQLRKG